MTNKAKPTPAQTLGADPFANMGDLIWLGVEPPDVLESESAVEAMPEGRAHAPKSTADQDVKVMPDPALIFPDDDAERALREWLREETPPEIPANDATPAPDAQAQLLARLLAEQEKK